MPATMTTAKRHGAKERSFPTHQAATAAMHSMCRTTGTSPDGVRVYPCDEGGDRHFHFGHTGRQARAGKRVTRMKRW
jgi:hypothetical protein